MTARPENKLETGLIVVNIGFSGRMNDGRGRVGPAPS